MENSKSFHTLEDVRQYVADSLCGLEMLKADQFHLSQQLLYRSGRPCGMHFCLQGPRELRLYAIWETDQNSILFYGSCGRRLHRTRLVQGPPLDA
jgi:hypothetical protein